MRFNIVYESRYKNNKLIVNYLKENLISKGHEAYMFSVENIKPGLLPNPDVYVFCSSKDGGNISFRYKRFLKKLELGKKSQYALVTTCIYNNSKSLDKMDHILKKKGMVNVVDGIKIYLNTKDGTLEEDYRKKLDWLSRKLTGGSCIIYSNSKRSLSAQR